MKPRTGLGRTALLGVMVVVLVIVVAGVFAAVLSGTKATSSTKSTTSSATGSTSTSSNTCSLQAGSTVMICPTSTTESNVGFNLSQPIGATFDPANGDLYVTNNYTNSVSVINVASDKLVTTIDVGNNPAQVLYDPANGYIYATNNESFTVTAIDGASNKAVGTIQTGGLNPDGMALDPNNNILYVAEHGNGVGGDDVTAINSTSNQYLQSIVAIFSPTGAVYDPANGIVYVTTGGSDVMVINSTTNVLASQVKVGTQPRGIALDPKNGDLYVANSLSGTVSVISTTDNDTVVATINVSGAVISVPYLVAYDPANGYIMVSNDYSSGVNVIDPATNTLVGSGTGIITTGFQSEPAGLAFDSTNDEMYVVCHATNAIVGISANLTATYLAPPTGAATASSSSSQAVNFGP